MLTKQGYSLVQKTVFIILQQLFNYNLIMNLNCSFFGDVTKRKTVRQYQKKNINASRTYKNDPGIKQRLLNEHRNTGDL